jgi:hypothetical protein
LVKITVNSTETHVRFHITNRSGRAKDLIEWYHQRGDSCENGIKELKLGLQADRLSCHRFRANAVRLQLHTIAFHLLRYFRRQVMAKTQLADATVSTLRVGLLKVGARVVYSARRIWFHVASHWPGQTLFAKAYEEIVARAPA